MINSTLVPKNVGYTLISIIKSSPEPVTQGIKMSRMSEILEYEYFTYS